MLRDWPDIDLPHARTRWEEEMAITRAYGGNRVRFKVLRSADDRAYLSAPRNSMTPRVAPIIPLARSHDT